MAPFVGLGHGGHLRDESFQQIISTGTEHPRHKIQENHKIIVSRNWP